MTPREEQMFKVHVRSFMYIMGFPEEEAIEKAKKKILSTRELEKAVRKSGFRY